MDWGARTEWRGPRFWEAGEEGANGIFSFIKVIEAFIYHRPPTPMDKEQQPFDVFISHSTKDSLTASAMKQSLQNKGIRCWKAPDDILPGESWPLAITRAISKCRAMVLVWTENSVTSMEVTKELTLAMRYSLTVIPFRIDKIEPAEDWEYHFANTHWMEATDGLPKDHFDKLGDRLLKALPAKDSHTTPLENQMALEMLEQLIEQALVDGVLTEQERTLLLRDAVKLGRGKAEFNAELDARLTARKRALAGRFPKVPSPVATSASPTSLNVPATEPTANSTQRDPVRSSATATSPPALPSTNPSTGKLILFGLLWSFAFIFGGLILIVITAKFSEGLSVMFVFLTLFSPVLAVVLTLKRMLPGTRKT